MRRFRSFQVIQKCESARALSEEITVDDFPIWLKLTVWGTIGLTVLYTAWGIVHSILAS
ncbi:MAG: hypothetical protein HW419_2943 [Deltaproteobacteria bacterium]|nr:hypothetical protein [Deltaproteobacteria bacterium]